MFTINFERRFAEVDLPRLREEIKGSLGSAVSVTNRAYGEAMLRTAGPGRMRHLEQRLANDYVLRPDEPR